MSGVRGSVRGSSKRMARVSPHRMSWIPCRAGIVQDPPLPGVDGALAVLGGDDEGSGLRLSPLPQRRYHLSDRLIDELEGGFDRALRRALPVQVPAGEGRVLGGGKLLGDAHRL